MLAVDETGQPIDGDQILAVLALALGVDTVAVTAMTNLGFHRLMAERGIRVLTTDVGDRHVLEALRARGGVLGGEQSGHVIYLDGHVTGDGLAAALLSVRLPRRAPALRGRRSACRGSPQAKENVAVARPAAAGTRSPRRSRASTTSSPGRGRVLVRPSGTEPLVRVLAEAEDEQKRRGSSVVAVASLVR